MFGRFHCVMFARIGLMGRYVGLDLLGQICMVQLIRLDIGHTGSGLLGWSCLARFASLGLLGYVCFASFAGFSYLGQDC